MPYQNSPRGGSRTQGSLRDPQKKLLVWLPQPKIRQEGLHVQPPCLPPPPHTHTCTRSCSQTWFFYFVPGSFISPIRQNAVFSNSAASPLRGSAGLNTDDPHLRFREKAVFLPKLGLDFIARWFLRGASLRESLFLLRPALCLC